MSDSWFKEWFSSRYYLELYKHRDANEAENLINLIQRTVPLRAKAKILDVCCGAGRHSIELAKRGYDVTGFDLSEFLINRARSTASKLSESKLKLRFQIKDMRDFDFRKSFDMVVNIFSSFGYFDNDTENFMVFHNAAASLKREGYFVFDYINERFLKSNIIKKSKGVVLDTPVIQKRRIENNFIIKDITIGNKTFIEKLKLYSLKKIQSAMAVFDLTVVKLYGDYYGNKFNINNSKRIIIFAVKE
ncbi:class I SAM-dependent methyltransferase [bacterium]|nr:MAG: class I SAM-dependent methyltransferase [bacterium]